MFIGQEIESLREIGISRRANPVRNLARALKSPAQNSTRYFRPHPCEVAREGAPISHGLVRKISFARLDL